jgi:uncharacterized protein YegP (UPF0339 family)
MFGNLIARLKGKKKPHLELFSDAGTAYRVRIRAANGEILMSSEAYSNESNAWRAIRVLAVNLNLDVREDK